MGSIAPVIAAFWTLRMIRRHNEESEKKGSPAKEAARDRHIRELIEEDERKNRAGKLLEETLKKMGDDEEEARIREAYAEAERENPWDYQFMPEGWSIFGQRCIRPINEHGWSCMEDFDVKQGEKSERHGQEIR